MHHFCRKKTYILVGKKSSEQTRSFHWTLLTYKLQSCQVTAKYDGICYKNTLGDEGVYNRNENRNI